IVIVIKQRNAAAHRFYYIPLLGRGVVSEPDARRFGDIDEPYAHFPRARTQSRSSAKQNRRQCECYRANSSSRPPHPGADPFDSVSRPGSLRHYPVRVPAVGRSVRLYLYTEPDSGPNYWLPCIVAEVAAGGNSASWNSKVSISCGAKGKPNWLGEPSSFCEQVLHSTSGQPPPQPLPEYQNTSLIGYSSSIQTAS